MQKEQKLWQRGHKMLVEASEFWEKNASGIGKIAIPPKLGNIGGLNLFFLILHPV